MVWNGRDGTEGPLAVDAAAPGVIKGSDQAHEGDFCRATVSTAVVAEEPVAPREDVYKGLQDAAVCAVAAAIGAARLAIGVDVSEPKAHTRATSEVLGVLLGGFIDPLVRDSGEYSPHMGVWKALGVVASNELLHSHVRCRGDVREDRGLGGPSPAEFKETGALDLLAR